LIYGLETTKSVKNLEFQKKLTKPHIFVSIQTKSDYNARQIMGLTRIYYVF